MSKEYHAPNKANYWTLESSSDEELERWGTDPDCIEHEECAAYLANRIAKRASARIAKRVELQDNPFDPRTEISADAKHVASKIVTHLWILFVLLPIVVGVLWAMLGAIK